jgi:hypothetical protein
MIRGRSGANNKKAMDNALNIQNHFIIFTDLATGH